MPRSAALCQKRTFLPARAHAGDRPVGAKPLSARDGRTAQKSNFEKYFNWNPWGLALVKSYSGEMTRHCMRAKASSARAIRLYTGVQANGVAACRAAEGLH
jgi:hypothetical protein